MREDDYAEVMDEDGGHGYIVGPSETNPEEVEIAWDDGRETSTPASSLQRATDGSWKIGNGTGSREQEIVPVLAEELNVTRRKRTTGSVRVGTTTTEHQETVAMPLTRERAHVRRVIIDRPIEQAPPIRREGNTIIVPVVEEVAVVHKQLVLKEELYITRQRTTEQHEETVTLREEHPAVERRDETGRRTQLIPATPTTERRSILGPNPNTRPARKNKILRDT